MLGVSIHTDAGLGNQIWRYVVCRVLADRLGYDYGVSHPGWRGPFLNIDWGKEVTLNVEEDADFRLGEFKHYYKERFDHHKLTNYKFFLYAFQCNSFFGMCH